MTDSKPRSRTRASAKQSGARFEREIADYLAEHLDDRIDRRVKTGAADRGDIGGVRVHGQRVVIECKNYGGRLELAAWLKEAATERANDDALAGNVFAKRARVSHPGKQIVALEVDEWIALITGNRNHIKETE